MRLFSFPSKKQTEATSVEEALAGTMSPSSNKSKNRRSEKNAEKNNADSEQMVPEKKRARRRLIGAIVMVLAVVIGLPMVLDSEPQAINKNIAIQIPSRDEPAVSSEPKEEVAAADTSKISSSSPTTETTTESKPVVQEAPVTSTPATPPVPTKPTESPAKNVEESTRALAILNDSNSDAAATTKKATRIVVQIGAFTTQEKVKELRGKLASAGIQSYTQKVATSSGDKIRVRIGPFDDKDAADKVKNKLDKLGLNGKLLSLE